MLRDFVDVFGGKSADNWILDESIEYKLLSGEVLDIMTVQANMCRTGMQGPRYFYRIISNK